jgi:hypothetical protein
VTWLYENNEIDEVPEKTYGFIYLITNTENGRKYIGRKFFTKSHTRQVNKKKKKSRVESDWKDYYGSSEELLADIEKYGKDKFKREILRLCKTLGETKYWEAKYHFFYNVLESKLPNGEWEYYNGNVMMKFTRRNIGEHCLEFNSKG